MKNKIKMFKYKKYALGYKIVRVNEFGQRVSLFINNSNWTAHYEKRKWTKPIPGTLILCYKTFKDVVRQLIFGWPTSKGEVWFCLMKWPTRMQELCAFSEADELKRFWFGKKDCQCGKINILKWNIIGAKEIMLLFRLGWVQKESEQSRIFNRGSLLLRLLIKLFMFYQKIQKRKK